MEYIGAIFSNLLPQIPSIILHAVGLWLSISRRKQYPRASIAAGIYFGLALLVRIASQIYVILPIYMQQQGTGSDIGGMFTTLNFVCIPIYIIMDIALLYAIFAPRSLSSDSNEPIFVGDQNA
jgi:hypothetical protein